MTYVNMHDAKSKLSKLVDAIESGAEQQITIARNGRPAAMLVPVPVKRPIRFGLGKGLFTVPNDFDRHNEEIAKLFYGEIE